MPKALLISTILALASCTSYIWSPVTRVDFETAMNRYIGAPYSMYPHSAQQLVNETDSYEEYEGHVYKDKNTKCSWIVRVSKNTNTIESWRYASTPCHPD